MIHSADFQRILIANKKAGWGEDIDWAEKIAPPKTAEDFAGEAIWTICCSGMKFTVARIIEKRCTDALAAGTPVAKVFKHEGKAAAIEDIWEGRASYFAAWNGGLRLAWTDKETLDFLESLPWIGPITKFQLAKNFGMDVCKPDVHMQRLADHHGVTPTKLCVDLARKTGFRIATVDTVLWRACAIGVINSKTGVIQ